MSVEIPGYKIIRDLGRGGMAKVYLAVQEVFDREVALKVLSSALAEDAKFSKRFFREARIVSKLAHPNIVTVHDVGMHDGHYFISMEYLGGLDLKRKALHMDVREKIEMVKGIAKALDYAGSKGYVHRDIKPENIMFHQTDGRAVLMDFGIAKAAETDTHYTQTGTTIGTPHYMSPEQSKGQRVDSRSDIYSLGAVFFWALTGHVPYDAESAVGIGIKHITEPVPELPDSYQTLQPIIDRMMAKKREERYQTARELLKHLELIDVRDNGEIVVPANFDQILSDSIVTQVVLDPAQADEAFEDDENLEQFDTQFEPFDNPDEFLPQQQNSIVPWFISGVFVLAVVIGFFYITNPLLFDRWFASFEKLIVGEQQQITVQATPVAETVTAVDKINASPVSSEEALAPVLPTPLDLTKHRDKLAQLIKSYHADKQGLDELVAAYRQLITRSPDAESLVQELDALRESEYSSLLEQAKQSGLSASLEQAIAKQQVLFPEKSNESFELIFQAGRERKKVLSLLLEANAFLQQNNLTQPEKRNALYAFNEVLKLDADNEQAKAGKSEIVSRLTESAQKAFSSEKYDLGLQLTDKAISIDPGSQMAQQVKNAIIEQRDRLEKITRLLISGEEKLAQNNLFGTSKDGAYYDYAEVLALDAENQKANKALEEIVDALSVKVWRLVGEKQFDSARQELRNASEAYADNPRIESLREAVEQVVSEE